MCALSADSTVGCHTEGDPSGRPPASVRRSCFFPTASAVLLLQPRRAESKGGPGAGEDE